MKKKIGTLLLTLILAFTGILAAGCSNTAKNQPKEKIKIAALKGPTGMGLVKLMEDNKDLYDITLYDSPDQIVSKIVNGEVDGAAVPSNLAPTLYTKTKGGIQMVAVNTLGILYIVDNGNTIKSIADLKGKTIVSSGKGGTPEFVLNYILRKNGLEPDKDVKIEFKDTHADLSAAVAAKQVQIAVLPEPFVTTTKMKDATLNVAVDLSKEWEKVSGSDSKLIMGAMIFRKDFIDKRSSDLDAFLGKYKDSVDYVNKNAADASKLIEKYTILPNAKIAEQAIPKSNIVFISAKDAKKPMTSFLNVLMQSDPKSIGGSMPDENFYYKGK
ncbi:MAG: ABC transporter substrate-binding protein [Solirubrobacterales bacterium]